MSRRLSYVGIALKNLFKKPATAGYPFVKPDYPKRSRGHIKIDADGCILCGACMRKCPTGCIKVDRANGQWSIDRFDCVQCSNCVINCPKKCLEILPGYYPPGTEKITETVEVKIEPPKPKESISAG